MTDKGTKTLDASMRAVSQQLPLFAVQQSPTLAAFYEGLPADVVNTCEQARQSMRAAFVDGLRKAHDALAGGAGGKTFKDWCMAAGISYNTANSALRRDDMKRHAKKQAGTGASHNRSAGDTPVPVLKLNKFKDKDEYDEATAALDRIMMKQDYDRWEAALLHALAVCEKRTVPGMPPPEFTVVNG